MSVRTQIHAAAFRRALQQAGEPFTWPPTAGTPVEFLAVRNPVPRERTADEDGVDRNPGDDTPGTLSALADDFPAGELPRQGDVLTDAAGLAYRVIRIEQSPGLPVVIFHFTNAVTSS